MFTHMTPVKRCVHKARGESFDILVFRVVETGEHRIYIAKGHFGGGEMFAAASAEVLSDAKVMTGSDLVEELIKAAKDDIDRNDFDQY